MFRVNAQVDLPRLFIFPPAFERPPEGLGHPPPGLGHDPLPTPGLGQPPPGFGHDPLPAPGLGQPPPGFGHVPLPAPGLGQLPLEFELPPLDIGQLPLDIGEPLPLALELVPPSLPPPLAFGHPPSGLGQFPLSLAHAREKSHMAALLRADLEPHDSPLVTDLLLLVEILQLLLPVLNEIPHGPPLPPPDNLVIPHAASLFNLVIAMCVLKHVVLSFVLFIIFTGNFAFKRSNIYHDIKI